MSAVPPWLIVGLTVLVGLSVVTGTEHEPVDQFGDLSKLIVHGADAFSPHRLRDALRCDFVTIVAAHPRAPLESLPQVVQERLLAGYQQAGHVDARVEVRINRAQHCLEAVIDEGPMYLCGEVRIEGAVSIDVAQLTERLTLPYVPEKAVKPVFSGSPERRRVEWLDRHGREVALEKAVWSPGEPAPMSVAGLSDLYKEVQAALQDLGFRASRFQVARVVDRVARTVELVVALIDEGSPTVIDDIQIVGAIRNGRQAILDYLELRPGTAADSMRTESAGICALEQRSLPRFQAGTGCPARWGNLGQIANHADRIASCARIGPAADARAADVVAAEGVAG